MNRIFILLFALCTLLAGVAKGQDGNNTKFFLENLPGRISLNPAYQPEYKTYIALPVLGGFSLNYNNSAFHVESLLKKGRHDSVYMDINRFHKGLNRRNLIMLDNVNTLLTLGFRAKNGWYWSVDMSEKNDFLFCFNRNIFTFLKNGNTDYRGEAFDLGALGMKGSMYMELALGLSKKVDDKLTVGGRLKFLRGIANVDMTDSEMSVYTSPDGDVIKLSSRQNIRVSAPLTYAYDKEGFVDWDGVEFNDDKVIKSLLSTRNIGFAVDLGAEYQLQEKLKLHASLLDLGFIRWGSNTYNFYQNTVFDWEGANLSNSINSSQPGYRSLDDAFSDLTDSLKNSFRFNDEESKYTTMLHAKLYLGATYEICEKLNFGGLAKATMYDGTFYPALTLSANSRLHRNFGATVSYTTMFGNYVNLGFGLTAKLGPIQLYAVTDNLLAANFTHTQAVSFNFGINILTGHMDFKPRERRKGPKTRTDIEVKNTPAGSVYTVRKKVGNQKTSVLVTNVLDPKKKQDTVYVQVPAKPDTTAAQPLVKAPVTAETDTAQKAAPEMITGKSYSVIVGSFAKERGAWQLKKEFARKGYQSAYILKNPEGMYQVCVASFNDMAQARKTVETIKQKHPENDDVWVRTLDM